jgi:2-polyprenyl-3-methyl-5-hydroxy-6-metoxy-1,4-benzoquinol methylase
MKIMAVGTDERELLLDAIRRSARDGTVHVLEAGCGQKWGLQPHGVDLHITGVDMDADAMRIRQERQGDLNVAIVGDLRTVALPAEQFDVVYCSYVLEHVPGAEKVLDRMAESVRPGGRMIVRVPDGDSVFGWVARHTPHRLHVWFKRYVERQKDAGKPGHAPYPTVYDTVVSAKGMRAWAGRAQVRIEAEYATNYFIKAFGPLRRLAQVGLNAIACVSRGKLTAAWNNIGYVLVKGG